MSTRSIQKPRKDPDRLTPDVAMQHAAAAASRAMRSSQGTSQESRASYDRLGGPANIAVPRRRPGSSLRCTDDSSGFSTPCYSKATKSSAQSCRLEDPAILPPITELKGLDGRDSSVPSSYRRLRKARSMFSTRPRTSQTPYGVPPLPCGDPSDPERSPGFQLPRTMRPSVSFIRGNYQPQKLDADGIHDTAMHLARSQFLQESNEPVTQHHRSSFFLRRKKEHKPFRNSFRATSEGAPSLAEQHTGRPRSASRSFSNSIKSRLRRVFGFSKVADQQLTLPDGSKCVETSVPIDSKLAEDFPCENSTAERCTTSNTFRGVSPSPSRGSLCTSRSRVTSWADSTIANTVTARKIGHRHSLSMVREDSDSYQQMPRTPAKKDVDDQVSSALRAGPALIGAVDSQDLYYALMEQMGHGILPNSNEDIVFGTVSKHRVVPDRSDSVNSQHGRRTIRHVSSRESSNSPGSFATARCDDQSSPHRHLPRPAKSMQICRGVPSQATYQSMLACFDPKSPRSADSMDYGSDDDRGSVIIARFDGSKKGVMSPSIYSRTTGGNTPVKVDTAAILDTSASDEAGTATIFAPQRTVYSSPRRVAPDSSSRPNVNPSGDWQQWINSQVGKIELAGPVREHIREDAQFQEDDEEDLTTITRKSPLVISSSPPFLLSASGTSKKISNRGTWMDNRLPSQSNFSRPFSQVSDAQSILPLQAMKPENTIQIPPADPVKNSVVESRKDIYPQVTSLTSPIRLRPGNLQLPESPTPKRVGTQRSWTKEQQRRYSARRAPIAQDGRANQFRSMRTQRDSRINNENKRQQDEFNGMMESYHQLQDIHSTISSKRMVDLFLDSRRRQMGEPTDNKTATVAFL